MAEFNVGFGDLGIEVIHHMPDDGSGVYAKEVRIPAGCVLLNHAHSFTHKSLLAAGTVVVSVDGVEAEHTGPAMLVIRHGVPHEVRSVTDAVWYCIHATDECDPERIDHTLIGD
jgi:hypothetical protein